MLDSCPLVRSLGQLVDAGRPFVWMPGELPFLGANVNSVQVTPDKTNIVYANRVEDHGPTFSETIQVDEASSGLAAASSVSEPVANARPAAHVGGDGDSENDDEEPLNRHARLIVRANPLSINDFTFQRIHIGYCEICQRGRMCKRKPQSYDSLSSRGGCRK